METCHAQRQALQKPQPPGLNPWAVSRPTQPKQAHLPAPIRSSACLVSNIDRMVDGAILDDREVCRCHDNPG